MILKEIIKEIILAEDLKNFLARTTNIEYSHSSGDPTFETNPGARKLAKQVKKIWNEEADHEFMKSLIKIHWMATFNEKNFKKLLDKSKSEISAMGYLPNSQKYSSTWSSIGVVLDGRVTLAANSMNSVYSGFFNTLPDEIHKKYSPSGTPKRATLFNKYLSNDFILDKDSFSNSTSLNNELILSNWKVKAIIVNNVSSMWAESWNYDAFQLAFQLALNLKIPILNSRLEPVDDVVRSTFGIY